MPLDQNPSLLGCSRLTTSGQLLQWALSGGLGAEEVPKSMARQRRERPSLLTRAAWSGPERLESGPPSNLSDTASHCQLATWVSRQAWAPVPSSQDPMGQGGSWGRWGRWGKGGLSSSVRLPWKQTGQGKADLGVTPKKQRRASQGVLGAWEPSGEP